MEILLRKIRSIAKNGGLVTFFQVIQGLNKLDQIKDFIILLFLGQKNKVTLWQEEKSDEIFIISNEAQ